MKKKLLVPGLLLLMGALSLSSCGDDPANGQNGKGFIAPVVGVDTGFVGAELISRAGEEARKVEDLSLTLTKADGTFNKTWPSVKEFDPEEQFPIGDYTIEVAYGDRKAEGFRAEAAYYASQDIKVAEATTTPVELTARRTHALISIRYTNEFEHYIKQGSVQVISSTGKRTVFAYDDDYPETRSAVIVPGKTRVTLDIEKYNGTVAEDIEVFDKPIETVANTHYIVTLDVNEGKLGTPVLSVTITDDVEVIEEDPIDISDDMLSAPAPEVTLEGIENGGHIEFVEGAYDTENPVKVQVVAKAGLNTITFKAKSSFLQLRAKWKAAINAEGVDLIAMQYEPDRQDLYKEYGLVCHGVWNQPDRMAVVDFTNVFNNIEYMPTDEGNGLRNNISEFILTSKDKNGKASPDTVSFSVKVMPLTFSISNPSKEKLMLLENEVDIDLEFNGGNPDKMVSFEAEDGSWKTVTGKVTQNLGNNLYRVHISGLPEYCSSFKLRAKFNNKTSVLDFTRETVDVTTAAGNIDVFANYAYVSLETSDTTDPVDVAPLITFWQNRKPLESERIGNTAMFKIKGLTPGTANTLTASLKGDPRNNCDTITLNTEAATLLVKYNGAMESWHRTLAPHSEAGSFGMDAYRWYANAEGDSFWSTRNELTTATSSGYTPYYVSYSGTVSAPGDSGLAAEISTLGYGEGSTFTAVGGNCKHTAAGMLFIGTHDASSETEETFNYGQPWSSRPIGFSFKYKYAPYNSESFKAYMVVENRDNGSVTELARTEFTSNASVSTFTSKEVFIENGTYKPSTLKATHIYIVFISSTAEKPAVQQVRGDKGAFAGYADSKRIGSVLTVDDIELIY